MKRKSNRAAYYYPPPEPGALERILEVLSGETTLFTDPGDRRLQRRYEAAMAPWSLLVGLAALGLGGFVYCLWKLIEGALMLGPLGRIYGVSHAVRRQLRKTRKSSTRKPPTPEALEAAWAKSRHSLEWKLRLGSMLEDLEPAVDQSYIRDNDGAVVGREPGIRGWLMEHCVEVFDHYKTAMGYKALAHRFRLAIDLPEPFTLEDILDALLDSIESIEAKEKAERDARRAKVKNSGDSTAAEAAAKGVTGASEAPREGAAEGVREVPREGAAKGAREAPREGAAGVSLSPREGAVTHLHSAVVERASGEAGKILEKLRKRNRKDGRGMGRSMGALDEILHGKLNLLHIPRSA